MKTFRIYFNDGNQKLLECENIMVAINYVVYELRFSASEIYKVEEV